jgi:hypothetical protein
VSSSVASIRVRLALDWNRRLMQQPPGAACSRCGIRNPFVLVLRRRRVICYRCRAMARHKSGRELHHLGGRPTPVAPVLIDANLHRVLTYLQVVWRRSGIAPGSPPAIALDVLALLVLSPTYMQVDD